MGWLAPLIADPASVGLFHAEPAQVDPSQVGERVPPYAHVGCLSSLDEIGHILLPQCFWAKRLGAGSQNRT